MKNVLKKCLQEKGYVDIKYICEMTDRRWDAVIEELGNEIYLNPEKMDLMGITVG
jgi:N12 class adenine-specific DNA methylase